MFQNGQFPVDWRKRSAYFVDKLDRKTVQHIALIS